VIYKKYSHFFIVYQIFSVKRKVKLIKVRINSLNNLKKTNKLIIKLFNSLTIIMFFIKKTLDFLDNKQRLRINQCY
jgi:hypothetical protein